MKKIILMLIIISASLSSYSEIAICYRVNGLWTPCPSISDITYITSGDSLACCTMAAGGLYIPKTGCIWRENDIFISSDVYLPVNMSMDTIACNIGSLHWYDYVYLNVLPRKSVYQRINGLIQECPSSPAITTVTEGDTLFIYRNELGILTLDNTEYIWANFQSTLYPEINNYNSSFSVIYTGIDSIYVSENDALIFGKLIRLNVLDTSSVGIEPDLNKTLSLYPNPASSTINVGPCTYSIFSLDGRIVDLGNTLGPIDITKLEPGIYFFQSKNKSRKFIKN